MMPDQPFADPGSPAVPGGQAADVPGSPGAAPARARLGGRRRAALAAALACCTAAGAAAGLKAAGPMSVRTAVADVSVEVQAPAFGARRGVEVYVPLADWGAVARITDVPARARVEVRRLDRSAILRAVSGGPPGTSGAALLAQVKSQLASGIRAAAVRAAAWMIAGAVIGGLLAMLIWERLGVRGRRLALAPGLAAVASLAVIAAAGAWAALSYDPSRLAQPSFYGQGSEVGRLIASADQIEAAGAKYQGQVEAAIGAIAGMVAAPDAPARAPVRALLASDLHSNALVLPAIEKFSAGEPVFWAGDFAVNGSRIEAGLISGVASAGHPAVAVSGNHDSSGLMRLLAAKGVVVLTHAGRLQPSGAVTGPAVIRVGALTVAGFEDPLEIKHGFPSGVRTALSYPDLPADQAARESAAAVERMWTWWKQLPSRPDVLMVHQEALASRLARRIQAADAAAAQAAAPAVPGLPARPGAPAAPKPLTILTGHTHRQRLQAAGTITIVNGGSAGAGGLFGAGKDRVGVAQLGFSPAGRLLSVSLVEADPFSQYAQARRVTVSRPDCDGDVVFCGYAPADASAGGTAAESGRGSPASLSGAAFVP